MSEDSNKLELELLKNNESEETNEKWLLSSRIIMDDRLYKAARGNVKGIPQNTMDDVLFKSRTPGVEMNNVLHVAAQHGNEGFIRQALEDYQPYIYDLLCEHNSKGETPLHLAAKFGQEKSVKALIDAHGHTEKPCWREIDKHGDTPLHMALRFGHQDTAILLVQRDVDLVSLGNKVGDSPAYIAADNLCERFLRTILDTEHYDQSSISFSGPFGMTVFHPARNLNDDIMLALVERRKELLKHQDSKGKTVLHYVVEDNIEPMISILLKADSSLGFLHDNDGNTPLHRASSMGSFPMVRTILELSPQSISMICDKGDHAGKTALHVAKMDACFLKVCLRHTSMKELVNVVDNEGNTLLHLALKHNSSRQDVADALLEVGGLNWRLRNNDGCTPMDLCKSQNKIPSTNLLVTREEVGGVDGNLENIDVSSTPMDLSKSDDNIPSNLRRLTSEYWRVNDEINMQIALTQWDPLDYCIDFPDNKWEEVFTTYSTHDGESIIHLAARQGHLGIISKACKWNYESRIQLLSAENSKAETPLHVAAAAGELQVVKAILNLSKSTDKLGNMKERLMVVIETPHPPDQDQDDTMENSDWEYWKPWRMKSEKGDTPLHMALRNGYQQVAICLLEWDPQLIYSTVNKVNESLLYLAASTGCFNAILEHILPKRHGDDDESDRAYNTRINIISKSGPHGQNALHALVRHLQDSSTEEVITSSSFDFDKPNVSESNKPSYGEQLEISTKIFKLMPQLLKYVDNDGKTPLHHAVEHGNHGIVLSLLWGEENRTSPLMYDNEGFTPLLRAVANGYYICARFILVWCPASLELQHAGNGKTMLHFLKGASTINALPPHFSTRVEKLINQTDKDGNTPLHCAVLESDRYKTRYLLSIKGVRFSIKNKQHHTPMDLCKQLITEGDTKQVPIRIALEDAIGKEKERPSQVPLLLQINNRLMSYSGQGKTSDDDLKKLLENLAVAAALLTTLTFAATFTIPGGYDQNTGRAIRMNETSVKLFVASDVVAMLLGVGVLLMYTFGATKPAWMRVLVIPCVVMLQCTLLATIISFISGVYAIVFQDAKWIAFLVIAIVGGVLVLFSMTPAAAQIVSAFLKWPVAIFRQGLAKCR